MVSRNFQSNLGFMDITVVAGGTSRGESVRNGISAIEKSAEFIAVHDAARPLLTAKWIDQIFAAARMHQAVIPGLKISSTVKRVGMDAIISATVDRTGLVQAQTPQVFRRDLLVEAYEKRGEERATDDAQLVERLGKPVAIVLGSRINLKVTTREDLRLAEASLKALPKPKLSGPLNPFADSDMWR